MKINGEPVTLVTSFDQLRAGLIVWVTGCRYCDGKHRAFLTKFDDFPSQMPDGSIYEDPTWTYLPTPTCVLDGGGTEACIGPDAVRSRRVYRVVGQLPLEKRARAKERAR